MNKMTVSRLIRQLQGYPADALCCGTFWVADDFLDIDESLTPAEIARAMKIADEWHDEEIGYNWPFLRDCVAESLAQRQ